MSIERKLAASLEGPTEQRCDAIPTEFTLDSLVAWARHTVFGPAGGIGLPALEAGSIGRPAASSLSRFTAADRSRNSPQFFFEP